MIRLLSILLIIIVAASAVTGQTTGTTPGATQNPPVLTPRQAYVWVCLGILLSIVLPMLRVLLPSPPAGGKAVAGETRSYFQRVWPVLKPYLVVALFSALTGIIIVAFANESLKVWHVALLAGYAWDSTLQKARGTDTNP